MSFRSNHRNAGQSKRKFMAKKKEQRREAKAANVKDDSQDFRINKVEKTVKALTKSTKAYNVLKAQSVSIPGVGGIPSTTVLTPGTFAVDLNQWVVGGGSVNDISGLYLTYRHIGLRYFINQDPDVSSEDVGTGTMCRVMLICVHTPTETPNVDSSSGAPSFQDIFAFPANAANMISADVMANYNRLNRSNFTVLHDMWHKLGVPRQPEGAADINFSADSNQTRVISHEIVIPKRCQQTAYNDYGQGASTRNYIDVAKNQYFLIYMCDNLNAETDNPTLTYNIVLDVLQ